MLSSINQGACSWDREEVVRHMSFGTDYVLVLLDLSHMNKAVSIENEHQVASNSAQTLKQCRIPRSPKTQQD